MKMTTLINTALLPGTPVVCIRDLGEYFVKRPEQGIIESIRITIDIDENLQSPNEQIIGCGFAMDCTDGILRTNS